MAIPIAAAGGAGDDSRGRGRIHEAQALLLRIGRKRLGPLVPEIEHCIRSIQDLKELEKLITRLLEVVSWQDLFPSE
jgi:Domain of unknown function (DUF4351)